MAIKKTFAKTATKAATTTQSNDMCCSGNPTQKVLKGLLLIIISFAVTYCAVRLAVMHVEQARVGWKANYDMIQQIYKQEGFKQQQKFQIEQTLQAIQQAGAQPAMQIPEQAQ